MFNSEFGWDLVLCVGYGQLLKSNSAQAALGRIPWQYAVLRLDHSLDVLLSQYQAASWPNYQQFPNHGMTCMRCPL